MNKMKVAIAALLVAVMAFSSCNKEKTTSQKLVKEFLTENLVSEDFKVMDYSDLSSTKLVTDSMCQMMRAKMANNELFKSDMRYAKGPKPNKMYFIRVKYRVDKDTIFQTFYLDEQQTRVVAFKEN
ncbi:MAG: hypothetical protein IKX44_01435 [Prevotella sp.]|nr:hypothetical protein [Prevotella sp.]